MLVDLKEYRQVRRCRWTGKKATTHSNGHAVQFLKVGGRTTAYVPALQPKRATTVKKGSTSEHDADDMPDSAKDINAPMSHEPGAQPSQVQESSTDKSDVHAPSDLTPGPDTEGSSRLPSAQAERLQHSRPVRKCRKVIKAT